MKKKYRNKTVTDKRSEPIKKKSVAIHFWQQKYFLPVLIALAITAIVFSGSLQNAFVNWDDEANLLENPNMVKLNWYFIKHIFTDPVIGNYNPLPILTFAIEHNYFGFEPFIYHLDNLLLHLICTFFVYRIFIELKLSPTSAFIGALLFGIHPMRVESVAWVTERKDVLFGVFYLSAIFLYIKNKMAEKPSRIYNMVIVALFILALFSKIQAVSLPLTMLVLDFYIDKKLSWKMIWNKAPYFIFSVAFGIIGFYFLAQEHSLKQTTNYTAFDRILVGCLAYIIYIIKFIYPYRMSPLYAYGQSLSWDFYAAPIGIAALILLAYVSWKKKWNWIILGLGIYTVNVMFLLQIVRAGQGLFADRFTYIPYLGLIFLLIYIIDYFLKTKPARKIIIYSAVGIYFLLFSVLTWQQIKIWENGGTLWTHVLKYYYAATKPWQNRSRYYRSQKQYDLAWSDLSHAIALRSDLDNSYNSRAKMQFDQQKFREAISDYDSSLFYNPKNADIYINLGIAHCALGEYDKGIENMTKGLDMKPEYNTENGYINLGQTYIITKQFEKANEIYDKLIKLSPYVANTWYQKGICLMALNKNEDAVATFSKAIEIGPSSGSYYEERAKAWYALGKKDKSKEDVIIAEKSGKIVDPQFKKLLNQN